MKRRIAYLVLFFLIINSFISAVEMGDDAPPFVLTDMNRQYVFSKNIYGDGWVLVDFYATTCVNCNNELPYIEDVYNEYKERGLTVFLLATDPEGSEVVKPFFEQRPTPLTILIDRYQKSVEKFGVEALPTIFLINPEGKIVYKETGFHEETISELKSFLEGGS